MSFIVINFHEKLKGKFSVLRWRCMVHAKMYNNQLSTNSLRGGAMGGA